MHPLKQFRKRHEPPLSQADLARLVGVDATTVTRWESGSRKVDAALLPMVCEKTGIPPLKLRPDLIPLAQLIVGEVSQ